MRKIFLFLLFPFQLIYAQIEHWEVVHPLKTITTLSGNYAEIRRTHFHGGLDFRTGGVENKPVYAIDEGYISKISISPRGYGKAVYINHPNGYTSLYAHLNGFTAQLDSIVEARQYEKQSFEIEISFQPNEYPVKKGELFALSGNTGSSGGPHLHFEIRKTDDQTLMNPMVLNRFFKVEDTRPPRILGIKIYGMNNDGVVNNAKEKKFQMTTAGRNRTLQGGSDIKAWGEIGFSVRSQDYMTGTHFIHTPRIIKLYVDNNLISEVNINNINVDDSRASRSFIDYAQFMRTGEFFKKSFRDPNSPLTIFNPKYEGTFRITEERPHLVRYEVYDDFGLQDAISFTIHGKRMEAPKNQRNFISNLSWKESHLFDQGDFLIFFPENALYTDLKLEYSKTASPRFHSDVHEIGNTEIPLNASCDISIKINNDTQEDKSKYFIAKLNANNIITGSAGGVYVNGFIVGKTSTFEKFVVAADNDKPIITPVNVTELHRKPYLRFKILDALSGIASYNGYINDEWVLFEYDAKSNTITHKMKNKTRQNKNHDFKLVVTDACGNSETFERTIYW